MDRLTNLIDAGQVLPGLVLELTVTGMVFVLGFISRGVWTVVRTAVLQRRHRVGGRYVMKYDRPSGDTTRRVRLLCTLKLRGRSFLGRGTFFEESWRLEGELDRMGNLIGSYRPNVRFVRATGTFCLQPASGHDWSGWWSGMTREADGIEGGPLELARIPRFKLRPPKSADEIAVVQSLRDSIPRGSVVHSGLETTSENTICAVRSKHVVGFVLFGRLKERLVTLVNGPIPFSVERADEGGKLGILWEVGVADGYRGRTVGSMLVIESIEKLRRLGCSSVVAFQTKRREPSLFSDLQFRSAEPVRKADGQSEGDLVMHFRASSVARPLVLPGVGSA